MCNRSCVARVDVERTWRGLYRIVCQTACLRCLQRVQTSKIRRLEGWFNCLCQRQCFKCDKIPQSFAS